MQVLEFIATRHSSHESARIHYYDSTTAEEEQHPEEVLEEFSPH
jgi:hypothetical protein